MKKVLVTGAAGSIGQLVIKYLLTEGKYEITALDLKNKKVIKSLKKYKKRINILYGDVCNRVLVEALVKDHDIIIHLASSRPPLADMKKGLAEIIDFNGTENIVRAINYYNPKCHLFFASTTSLYKESENATVRTKINLDEYDYYSKAKYEAEKLIKEKIKNYTIYRLPLVLSDPRYDAFMYHINKNKVISFITKEDAAFAFVRGINYTDKINHKTYNVASEEKILTKRLFQRMLLIYGVSFRYIGARLFLEKNYYSPTISDQNDLNDLIHFQSDTLSDYYNRLRSRAKKRNLPRFIAKIFVHERKLGD